MVEPPVLHRAASGCCALWSQNVNIGFDGWRLRIAIRPALRDGALDTARLFRLDQRIVIPQARRINIQFGRRDVLWSPTDTTGISIAGILRHACAVMNQSSLWSISVRAADCR